MHEIVVYKNLHDTYNAMGLPVHGIENRSDFTINNLAHLHPVLPFRSGGFRPGYFSFLFVKDGKGNYTTDEVTFQTQPGTIYFTNPGNFKSFEWFNISDITLITLTESYLQENVHRDIFGEFPFLLSETITPRNLSPEAFAEFEQLYTQILETHRSDSPYKHRMIGNFS